MKKKNKIIIHLCYWFYMLNQLLFPLYISSEKSYNYADAILALVLNVINFYVIYFSFSFFLKNKNKFISVFLVLVMIMVISAFRFYVELVFYKYIIPASPKDMMDTSIWFYNDIRLVIIHGIYAVLIRFAIDWFDTQKIKSEMIQQTQASELALLRSQVNPHFLFNTLNNIYSLVYMKSEDAPAALMKLSSIMRYMLYDSNTDKVLLEKEVDYLKSFIELQKLRLKQPSFVEMNVFGEINGKTIAPMLLIPFVENAFKHSSKNVPDPGIRINLTVEPTKIIFMVSNYRRKNPVDTNDKTGGIGMTNIRRRLDLLYPGRHSLEISQTEEMYDVKLIIEN